MDGWWWALGGVGMGGRVGSSVVSNGSRWSRAPGGPGRSRRGCVRWGGQGEGRAGVRMNGRKLERGMLLFGGGTAMGS